MGYATTTTGLVGEVSKRAYAMVHAIETVPTVIINGIPAGWQRLVHTGICTETTTVWHGLSAEDCESLITESPAYITMSNTNPPHESASRSWNKTREGDSSLFNLVKTERSITG